ncbi:MAG: hypothetical protein ACTSVV_11325 [Promethearchaeota archaeon]
MNTIVALSYFHRKIGPLVFYSYPEGMLDEELSVRIANIMDQTFSEGFFTHSFEDLYSMNYYFEIPSEWARGNKEMLMVSIIFDKQTTPEVENNVLNLCNEFSERLQKNEKVFSAFYINDLTNFSDEEQKMIIANDSLIKLWVRELYWATIEDTREKTEEEKIASIMNKRHIFLTLEKLAKGPISLEGLKEWFEEQFEGIDFNEVINTLVEKQFIFINQIGLVDKYVLLLKEVNAERIPPDSVILFIDEMPDLIDILLPKVQEYFSKYEEKSKEELKEDSFVLFKIMSDPKIYNVLSELRNGLIPRDKLPKLVSKKTLDSLDKIIDTLKKHDIIEELIYNNERYIVLKTNLQITTAFPEYLRKLLPRESKPVIATTYNPKRVDRRMIQMAEIFKDVRDKGDARLKQPKISTFLEDLSSSSKRDSSNLKK